MCGESIHLIVSLSLSSSPVAGVWWAHWHRCPVAAVVSSKWMLHTGGGWGETPLKFLVLLFLTPCFYCCEWLLHFLCKALWITTVYEMCYINKLALPDCKALWVYGNTQKSAIYKCSIHSFKQVCILVTGRWCTVMLVCMCIILLLLYLGMQRYQFFRSKIIQKILSIGQLRSDPSAVKKNYIK